MVFDTLLDSVYPFIQIGILWPHSVRNNRYKVRKTSLFVDRKVSVSVYSIPIGGYSSRVFERCFSIVANNSQHGLFQEIFQPLAPARMTQLAQRLRLDLANSFPGYTEYFAYFLQRPRTAVIQSEAQPKHVLFPLG